MKFPSTVVAAALLFGTAFGAAAATPTPNIVVHENVQIEHFYGYAYDLETGKYRYTEVHERQIGSSGELGESVRYYAPDGTLIATRTLDFSGDPFLPRFRLDQLDTPRSVGITRLTPQHIDAFRLGPKDKAPERQTLPRTAGAVALAGLDNFIRAHLEQLEGGKPMHVPLFSAENFDTRPATVSRLKNGVLDHHATVRFKVVSSSWLRLVKGQPILLSYDTASRRLVEYRGISELDAPHTHKPWTVRVSYAGTPPADAPAKLPPLDAADTP